MKYFIPALSQCGVHFCPDTTSVKDTESVNNVKSNETELMNENFKTTDTQIYVLAGVYLACSLLGPILIAAFVDPLSRL